MKRQKLEYNSESIELALWLTVALQFVAHFTVAPALVHRAYLEMVAVAIAEMEMLALNDRIHVELFGQELNPESFVICKSDMLVRT